ncbi:hypothetical protein STEG23_032913, partial [Scotinomys teguina]
DYGLMAPFLCPSIELADTGVPPLDGLPGWKVGMCSIVKNTWHPPQYGEDRPKMTLSFHFDMKIKL